MFAIMFWDCIWTEVAKVSGTEFAYEVYNKACELAAMLDKDCILMDTETGEVLAQLNDEG